MTPEYFVEHFWQIVIYMAVHIMAVWLIALPLIFLNLMDFTTGLCTFGIAILSAFWAGYKLLRRK